MGVGRNMGSYSKRVKRSYSKEGKASVKQDE